MEARQLFYLIIVILSVNGLVHMVLNAMNSRRYTAPIPSELKDVYDQESYEKSMAYQQSKYAFGQYASLFSIAITLLFFFLEGFSWIDQWAQSITQNKILVSLLFFAIIMLGNDLISLPFSYYQTFVIEEKFGFNKTTVKTFAFDKIKDWILTAAIGGGIMALVIWLYQLEIPNFWIYAWALIALFIIALNMSYTKIIVPLFNTLTPLEPGPLRDQIEAYASKVGFRLKNISVIDGSKRSTKANAYFSGLGSEKRVTLYDTLIDDLNTEEIVAVLAHEIGHYKKKHVLINLLLSLGIMGITLWVLALMIGNPLLSEALGVDRPAFHIGLIAFGILYSPISEATGLVINYISRRFEYEADNYAKNTYIPEALINSLKKLSRHNLNNLSPHPAYVFMHYTHPTLLQRIRNLSN